MNHISTQQKAGLALAGLLFVTGAASVLAPRPEGTDPAPLAVTVIVTLLGILGLGAVIVAWRTGRRESMRLAAGSLIVIQLTAVPALFVDTPAAIKVWIGASMLLMLVAIVLIFSPVRKPVAALS